MVGADIGPPHFFLCKDVKHPDKMVYKVSEDRQKCINHE